MYLFVLKDYSLQYCISSSNNGFTEQMNQTSKEMLKKFAGQNPKSWDTWLLYLLFAYREVPQMDIVHLNYMVGDLMVF